RGDCLGAPSDGGEWPEDPTFDEVVAEEGECEYRRPDEQENDEEWCARPVERARSPEREEDRPGCQEREVEQEHGAKRVPRHRRSPVPAGPPARPGSVRSGTRFRIQLRWCDGANRLS